MRQSNTPRLAADCGCELGERVTYLSVTSGAVREPAAIGWPGFAFYRFRSGGTNSTLTCNHSACHVLLAAEATCVFHSTFGFYRLSAVGRLKQPRGLRRLPVQTVSLMVVSGRQTLPLTQYHSGTAAA